MTSAHRRFFPRRPLGRTRFVATRIGAGDVADRTLGFETCVATLVRALDLGINLVDTAPSYEDGFSEEIVGAALATRREGVFLIDKIDHFDRPVATQIDASLARLRLPFADAFVFHGVSTLEAWNAIAAPRGPMDELAREVERGRARFRGISSHHPAVLRAALESGTCDLVMFAIGPFADARYEREVLPLARACGAGTVCFKTFGAGKLLGDTLGYQRPLENREPASPGATRARLLPSLGVEECVRYTLSIDPDVALLGLSTPEEQDEAFAAVRVHARALEEGELGAIRVRARHAIAAKGDVWWDPPDSRA